MAMSSNTPNGAPRAEINTTPLIDVMLVLLVMLIVTLPMQTQAVKVTMPQIGSEKPLPAVSLEVDFDGSVLWNGVRVDRATVDADLAGAARQSPQPEIHLTANRLAKYDSVAKVMSDARRLGVTDLTLTGTDDYLH